MFICRVLAARLWLCKTVSLAAQDPDLKALRDRREWLDAVEKARGGVSSKAYANARAESKSPFRLVRLLTFGGLGAGAGIGLFIIISRLITALRGWTPVEDGSGLFYCAYCLRSVLDSRPAVVVTVGAHDHAHAQLAT